MADWCHAMLEVLSAGRMPCGDVGRVFETVEGRGWVPIPPERCTDEYKAHETLRLCNELGRSLGVGDYPSTAPLPVDHWYGPPR
jgi:hypothetical protein